MDDDTGYSCMFKFGSWSYDGFALDVDFYQNVEEFDLADFINSRIYSIHKNSAVKNVKYYPCCQEPYPDLTFRLDIYTEDDGWWNK